MCRFETTYWTCQHHKTKVFECDKVKDRPFRLVEPCYIIEDIVKVLEECEECKGKKEPSTEQSSRKWYGEVLRQQSRKIARKLSTKTRRGSSGTMRRFGTTRRSSRVRRPSTSSGLGCLGFFRGHFSSNGTRKVKNRDARSSLEDSGVLVVGLQPQVPTPSNDESGPSTVQDEQTDTESLSEKNAEVNEPPRPLTPPPDFESSSIESEGRRQDEELCLPEHQLLVPSPAEKKLRMEREAVELFFSDYPTVMNPDTSFLVESPIQTPDNPFPFMLSDTSFFVDSPAQIPDNPFPFKQSEPDTNFQVNAPAQIPDNPFPFKQLKPDTSFFVDSPAQILSNPFPFYTASPVEPKVTTTPTQPKASELPIGKSFSTPALSGKANQVQPTVRPISAPAPPPKVSLVESEAIELPVNSTVMTPRSPLIPSAMEPPEPCSEDNAHLRHSLISFPSLERIQAALAYADEEQVSPPISPVSTTMVSQVSVMSTRPQTPATQPHETFTPMSAPAITFQQMEFTGVNLNGAAVAENSVPIMNETLIPY